MQDLNGITFDNKVFEETYKGLHLKKELLIRQGGTYSGKTFNILLALLIYLKTIEDQHQTTSIVGASFPQLRRGALKDWKDIINRLPGYITYAHETTYTWYIGNQKVEFFSADQPENMRSGKRQRLFIDEANLIDWESANLLIGKTDITAILAYNPYSRFWLHENIIATYNKDQFHFQISTFKDNKHLTQKTLSWLDNMHKVDPEGYRVLGEGKIGQSKGIIFNNVKYVDSIPKECRYIYGLDLGYIHDPTVLVKLGKYQGKLYGQEIFYETGYGRKEIVRDCYKYGITEEDLIVMDKDFSLYNELKEAGLNVIFSKKEDVLHGIRKLKEYQLYLLRSSANWHKEQLSYRFKIKDGKVLNEPIDENNHAWDACRYAAEIVLKTVPNSSGKTKRRFSVLNK